MSYTQLHEPPDLELQARAGKLIVIFSCPRCETKQAHAMDIAAIHWGFEVACSDPRCAAPGEGVGYYLKLLPIWDATMLGLNDRPLHD